MRVTVEGSPAYAVAYCHLQAGETVFLEPDAMAVMSEGVSPGVSSGGSIAKGILRKAFGGESFFLGAYTADVTGAWVAASPKFPGDVSTIDLSHTGPMLAQSGSLVAFDDRVDVSVRASNAGGALATRGLTLLRIAGTGVAVLGSYGAIHSFDILAGQSLTVDTGHLVAFTETVQHQVGFLSDIVTSTATGENLVSRLTGPGTVLVQTRAENQLRSWLNPERQQNTR